MASKENWLIKIRENYTLICYLNKNTVSIINLTFRHQNETCEITKFILWVLPDLHFPSASMRAGNIFLDIRRGGRGIPGLEKGCWLGWTPRGVG